MGESDSGAGRRGSIDREAKARFLDALRAGLKRDDAAARAGFTANGFYYARTRDPLFARAWAWAADLSAADQRAAVNAARNKKGAAVNAARNKEGAAFNAARNKGGAAFDAAAIPETVIAPNRNRRLQRRIVRRPRFDERRKRLFLDHFAGTADAHAAAAAAGIGYPTVNVHRRRDAAFAAAWDEALAYAYACLEAEAVRQRLAAQARLRDGLCPAGEIAGEFDRVMQLLARYDRRNGAIGARTVAAGRQQRWTFEDAIAALDKKLTAMGARRALPPPPPAPEAE